MSEDERRPEELGLVEQELFERVGWFIKLRWLAVLGASLALLVSWYVLGVRFSVRPLVGVILGVLFYNVFFALFADMVRKQQRVTSKLLVIFANVQISADLMALVLLVHFAGGVETLRIMFFVFHMIIASELLSRRNAYLQATFAVLLLNGLCWLEYLQLVDHHPVAGLLADPGLARPEGLHQNWVYVVMVSAVATATLYISVYLASSIAARLRAREGDLGRAYRRLQAVDSEKSYFMRRAGHGLRSPLAAIQSLLRLVTDGFAGEAGERPREIVGRAIRRTDELIALVNDLLRYSRLQADLEPSARQAVSLDTVLNDAVDTFRPLADEKKVALELTTEPSTVLGDPEDLADLVTNLISNAIKYTPTGGAVRVALRRDGSWARLDVSDTGIGIPAEAREHVFEEFYRAANAKALEPGGTGLGLAIAKRVVAVKGGDIWVDSTPDVGSTFSVKLPVSERTSTSGTGWPPPETP